MSRTYIYLSLAAACLLAACTDKLDPAGALDTITASLEQLDTKSSLDGRSVLWESGDAIMVYNADTPDGKVYYLKTGAGTSEGTFFSNDPVTGPGPYTAVYPASTASGTYPSGIIVDIPSEQHVSGNLYNIALAKGDDLGALFFRNAGGLLKLTIQGSAVIMDISIRSKSDEPLRGPFKLNTGGVAPSLDPPDLSGANSVNVQYGARLLSTEGTDFYIFLPKGTLSQGFYAVIKDDTYHTMNKNATSTGANTTIAISRIRPMPAFEYVPGS